MHRKIVFATLAILVLLSLFVVPTRPWTYPDCTEDTRYEKFGPRADRLLIKLYANETAEFLALEAGEIDIVDWPLTHAFKEKWKNPPYNEAIKEVSYGADFGMYVLEINNNGTQPDGTPNPTRKPELRHAIAHCVNKSRIVDECLTGQGYPLWSLVGPAWPDYIHPEIRPGGLREDLCHLFNCTEATRIINASGQFRFAPGLGSLGIESDRDDNPATPGDHLEWHPEELGCTWEDVVLKFVIRSDDPQRTCAGDIIADELERCLGIQVVRVYLDSSGASMQVKVDKHFNLYTGGWSLGIIPDWLVLYNARYYSHPGFCINYGHVNCAAYNYWTDIVEMPTTIPEAIDAAKHAQEAIAAEDCVGVIPLYTTEGVMAHRRCYSGGNAGQPVSPDDGENKYRCQLWKGIVNPPGVGIMSWWSMLNMHPEGHPMGDCENMTIRWGFKVPELTMLNPLYASWLYDWNVLSLIYDSLLQRDPHTYELIPHLAKHFEVGTWIDPSDGETKSKVIFTLRSDICWHDGVPFSTADIMFTLYELPKLLEEAGLPPPRWWNNVRYVRGFRLIDACSIEVLLDVMSIWAVERIGLNIILPKHIWLPLIESYIATGMPDPTGFSPDPNLIGNGPWRLLEYVAYSHILLLANKPCLEITTSLSNELGPAVPVHNPCGHCDRCPVHVNVHTLKEYVWVGGYPPVPPYNSSQWHQVKGPDNCTEWHLEEWIDNGDGVLSQCDRVMLAKKPELTETVWEHVYLFNETTGQLWTDWYSQKVPPWVGNAFGVELHNQWLNPIPNTAVAPNTGLLIVNKYVWLVYPNGTEVPLVYDETVELPACLHHKEIFNLELDRCHHQLKVAVHIKGPEMIEVTKEGGTILVPNPWICQWINHTYDFWVTIKEDICGDMWPISGEFTNVMGMKFKPGRCQYSVPDCYVNILDIVEAARAFGTYPGHARWDGRADVTSDYLIDIRDIYLIAKNFGWGGPPPPKPGPAQLVVNPTYLTVGVGSSFTVDIDVVNVTDLYAFEFKLRYDTTILDCIGVTEGPFLQSAGATIAVVMKINETIGVIEGVAITLYGLPSGVSGSGTLATINFIATAEGTTALDLFGTQLADSWHQPIGHTVVDGTVEVTKICMHDIAIIDITAPETVIQGEVVDIAVTLENQGDFTENFTLYASFCVSLNLTLAPKTSTTIIYSVDTSDIAEGNYTLWAYVLPCFGDCYPYNNIYVDGVLQVIAKIHDIAIIDVSPSKTVVGQGYNVTIHVILQNQGNLTETFTVWTFCGFHENVTLSAGASTTVTYTFDTSKLPKGDYRPWAYVPPCFCDQDPYDNIYVDDWIRVTIPGDVNGDWTCDMLDISILIDKFLSEPSDPEWDPNCDINDDNSIDMLDISIAIDHFLEDP